MKKITRRDVVAPALILLSVALLFGAVACAGFLIVACASVIGLGDINWGNFVMLFLFFWAAPPFGAIAVWKAANHVRHTSQSSIQ